MAYFRKDGGDASYSMILPEQDVKDALRLLGRVLKDVRWLPCARYPHDFLKITDLARALLDGANTENSESVMVFARREARHVELSYCTRNLNHSGPCNGLPRRAEIEIKET